MEKLRADVAKLKAKLVAAENAAEAAALLKSKVARLEAQLKKKGCDCTGRCLQSPGR